MKKLALFVMALLISVQVYAVEPAAPSVITKNVADKITAFAAGFCKGMADKHGMDFAICFKQATDIAIAKLESLSTDEPRREPCLPPPGTPSGILDMCTYSPDGKVLTHSAQTAN